MDTGTCESYQHQDVPSGESSAVSKTCTGGKNQCSTLTQTTGERERIRGCSSTDAASTPTLYTGSNCEFIWYNETCTSDDCNTVPTLQCISEVKGAPQSQQELVNGTCTLIMDQPNVSEINVKTCPVNPLTQYCMTLSGANKEVIRDCSEHSMETSNLNYQSDSLCTISYTLFTCTSDSCESSDSEEEVSIMLFQLCYYIPCICIIGVITCIMMCCCKRSRKDSNSGRKKKKKSSSEKKKKSSSSSKKKKKKKKSSSS